MDISNLVWDTEDPRVKDLIGKEVRYGWSVKEILADDYSYIGTLDGVDNGKFLVDGISWDLITAPPVPSIRPFSDFKEFVKFCLDATNTDNPYYVYQPLIRDKDYDEVFAIAAYSDTGVRTVFREYSWEELLEYCCFVDGTPCGKEVK